MKKGVEDEVRQYLTASGNPRFRRVQISVPWWTVWTLLAGLPTVFKFTNSLSIYGYLHSVLKCPLKKKFRQCTAHLQHAYALCYQVRTWAVGIFLTSWDTVLDAQKTVCHFLPATICIAGLLEEGLVPRCSLVGQIQKETPYSCHKWGICSH